MGRGSVRAKAGGGAGMKRRPRSLTHLQCPAQIRAVTFDAGGTLIECWPSVGHIYAAAAARAGFSGIGPGALNRAFASAWHRFRDFRHAREQWAALVDATFGGLVQRPPSETFFAALYERFAEPEVWHVFEDVIPTLEALRSRGFKLGVVSNWDERLRPLLRKLKLTGYFDAVVVSCEAGACKPSPVIFREAARALGLRPAQILHVGDSREADVRGARAAGGHALWLRRKQQLPQPGVISSLRELAFAEPSARTRKPGS